MNRHQARRNGCATVLLALLVGLCGCGTESPTRIVRPPAPPPPFVPQAVDVALGSSGSTVTLMTTPGGGYSLNGEAFTSGGEVAAANGNAYVLTLREGTWSTTFKAPDPVGVPLGKSGESVTITKAEDGSYRIGQDELTEGIAVRARNGNVYKLSVSADGGWAAVFQPPDPVLVTLGTSGSTVEIQRAEDGSYRIGQEELTEDYAVQAANGNWYTLTLAADGLWIATYRAEATRVALGKRGAGLDLVREEDGSYSLDGRVVESGTVLQGRNGGAYRLTLGPDGTWIAEYQVQDQRVPLGTSGFVTLTRAENGDWSGGDGPVQDGDTLVAENGGSYMLRFRNGYWSAEFIPEREKIAGTGLVATRREDGRGYRIGTSALLRNSGRGDVTVDQGRYHVWKQGRKLRGARFDSKPDGFGAGAGNFRIGTTRGVAKVSEDDDETLANENRTKLIVGGGEFAFGKLLNRGTASFKGENLVLETRENIQALREEAVSLLQIFDDDLDSLRKYLGLVWQRAQEAIDKIFSPGRVELKRTTRENALIETFDNLIEVLSSETAFEAATREDGGGIFEIAALSQEEAREVYRAVALYSRVVFRATRGTRYGAVRTTVRDLGYAVNSLTLSADGAGVGAFGYSTIPDTVRSRSIESEGSAYYEGGTVAVSGDGKLYTGDIELLVLLRSDTVSGLITNLRDEKGEQWSYLHSGVDAIVLPDANLRIEADWDSQADPAARAMIHYNRRFQGPAMARSTFMGHLLGVGASAGGQVVGVWSVGDASGTANYLVGGFGAERMADRPQERNVPDEGEGSQTTVVPLGTYIENGILTVRGTQYGPNLSTTETEKDWDDEMQLLDDGRRIDETYRIPLGELLARQDDEREYLGRNLLDLAREEIGRLREQLAAVVGLNDDTQAALGWRARIWEQVNDRIRARLFGTDDYVVAGEDYLNDAGISADDPRKWSSGYPVDRRGRPLDTKAVQALDAVIQALESPDGLEEAVKENSDGVFTREDGQPFRAADYGGIGEIWDRAEARIRLWLGSTEYTRFGAWRKQTAPNAWSDYKDRLEGSENGPNSFAYSQLSQTHLSAVGYPAGGLATYQGETVATQGSTFYTGPIALVARWHATSRRRTEVGLLSAVISDLQSHAGKPLTYTAPYAGGEREKPVGEILLANIEIQVDEEGRLYFSDQDPRIARIGFTNQGERGPLLSDDPSASVSIEGKFVGQALDGPQGAVGIWTLHRNGDTRIGTGGKLYGAFGAELRP